MVKRATNGAVHYYKFCCRIRIVFVQHGSSPPGPYDELVAAEPVPAHVSGEWKAEQRHEQFAEAAVGKGWFTLTPALKAHLRALQTTARPLKSRLVDTAAAVLYTGRDRQVLYRWAKEGRVTRYYSGTGTGTRVMWDVWELPPGVKGKPLPPPPPKII